MTSQLMSLSGFSSHQKSLLTALQTCSQHPVSPASAQDPQHMPTSALGRGDRAVQSMLFALDQFQFEWGKQHSHGKKFSEYRYQLKERTKCGVFYGNLATHMVSRVLTDSQSHRGNYQRQMIGLLEQRLDMVLFRSGLVKSIKTAQQFITHGHVLVNASPVDIPSCRLSPGDVVCLTPHVRTSRGDRFRELLGAHRDPRTRQASNVTVFPKPGIADPRAQRGGDLQLLAMVLAHKIASRILYSTPPWSQQHGHHLEYIPVKYPKGAPRGGVTPKFDTVWKRRLRESVSGLLHTLGSMGTPDHLVSLHMNRSLAKHASGADKATSWWLMPTKPVHLEISYALSRVIYLYAPQRVTYPFPLQLDDLRRSF